MTFSENISRSAPPRAGWAIVPVGFLILTLAFAATSLPVATMVGWSQEFGVPLSELGTIGLKLNGLTLASVATIAPFAGWLLDRKGAHFTLSLGLIPIAVGCAAIAAVDETMSVLGPIGFTVAAAGCAVVGLHTVTATVARHAVSGPGLATGVVVAGVTVGSQFVSPFLLALFGFERWRLTFAAAALASLALIPFIRLAIGPAEGADRAPGAGTSAKGDLASILTRPVFYLLFLSLAICGFTTFASVETALMQMAFAEGFGRERNEDIVLFLSLGGVAGTIGAGWLADRVRLPLLLGAIYFLTALTFAFLLNFPAISANTLNVAALLYGATGLAAFPVTARLVAARFGLRAVGFAMGLLSAGFALGGAMGWMLSILMVFATENRGPFWILSLCLAAVAGAMALFTGPERETPARA